ncbi:hypothetical protein FJW10_12740 [Mesorhizobium sp. B4-1-1]|nr:hypothetical protein FJW10_12740 [Mesorhizobium sp. B4-1-1]
MSVHKFLRRSLLGFAALDEEFFLASTIRAAKTGRFMAIGRMVGGVVAVVFARLGSEGVSIVSMRPANQTERRLFDGES